MTLAAGYKFEHPRAQGVSPILLLSDSRYSYRPGTRPPRDDGKKVYTLARNIGAVFAGNVPDAERALDQVKECLALSSSGSFEDLESTLKSSFDSTIATWDDQTPHCLLGAISTKGDSKLFYARPDGRSYRVSERTEAVIGSQQLGLKLKEKMDEPKPSGLYRLSHFMLGPDDMFPSGYDPKDRATNDARQISSNISRAFIEIVEDLKQDEVHLPLQSVLLLPSGPEYSEIYDIASSRQISRKTARPKEVHGLREPNGEAIVELDIR